MSYDLTISLTGANGDTITFDNTIYTLTDGLKGFGIPTTKVRIQEAATDGGIFRHTKRGIREVDLPITVYGGDRASTENALRRLSNILQASSGATTLTATYANGDVYYLYVYYVGGGETQFGETAGTTFAQWMVTLQAPQPYWTSTTAQSFSVSQANTGRGLLPQLSKMRVSSSQTIGTVVVNNASGDVPSYPVWTIKGPISNLQILNGSGVGFNYTVPLLAGEILTIDTLAGTVKDLGGANKYANLGPAPKLFSLPPGTTTVYVNGTLTDANTRATCTYYPRREVLH